MMKVFSLLFILFPFLCLAHDTQDFRASFEDMLKEADFVGIVKIVAGEQVGFGSYRLKYEAEIIAKQVESLEKNEFYFRNSFTEEPSVLGGYYLVFLENDEGNLVSLNMGYSVTKVSILDISRADYDLVLSNLALDRSEVVLHKDDMGWYPEVCTRSNQQLCEIALKLLRKSLGSGIRTNTE